MSSQRRNQPAAGPPPERKAPTGPVITPQVLMVVYFLILVVGVITYWNMVVKKSQEQVAAAQARATTAQGNIETYQKKGKRLEVARKLSKVVREKLHDTSYMFMTDQNSLIPFWEDTLNPILRAARIFPDPKDAKVKADKYVFKLNMAMSPFNSLPSTQFFDNEQDVFAVEYLPEQNGTPVDTPLDTRPQDFLTPYTITLENWRGTYEDVKSFVKQLQLKQDKTLFTVHCFKNKEDKNVYSYRTLGEWTIVFTVYFMNPESTASGDAPPAPPGASSC